jgi:HK97 family phage prohead protease
LIAETARLHRQPHSSVGDKSYASWRGARGFLPLQVAGLAIRAGYWLPYQNETHRAVFGPSALDTCVAAARAGTSRSIALVPSHDDEYPLATTRDSTLMLELDGHDLIFWARLRDDHLGRARATADAVRAGRYCGVSILYTEEKSHRERQFGETIEVVDEARLLHIALVAPPARPAFHLSTIHILED